MPADIQNFIHRRRHASRGVWLALAAATPLALSACSPPQELRGNLPDPGSIAQVTPGKTTKAEVTHLLGSPSNISTFDNSTWYYIARRSVRDALSEPQLVAQTVYVVQFDDSGVVKSFQQQDDNNTDVAMIPRTTPASGKELSLIEQLLGNFGKFSNSDEKKKTGG
jgi:outer membrane protein assembly factor BamE (lipoprotein component of BamABCDE complex)